MTQIRLYHVILESFSYHQNNEDVIEKYLKTKDKIKYTKTGKLDTLDDDLLLSGRAKNMFFGRYFEFKNKPLDIMKLDDEVKVITIIISI